MSTHTQLNFILKVEEGVGKSYLRPFGVLHSKDLVSTGFKVLLLNF